MYPETKQMPIVNCRVDQLPKFGVVKRLHFSLTFDLTYVHK